MFFLIVSLVIKKKRIRVRSLGRVLQMESLIIISKNLKYDHPTKYFQYTLWYQLVVAVIQDKEL